MRGHASERKNGTLSRDPEPELIDPPRFACSSRQSAWPNNRDFGHALKSCEIA